MATTKLVTIPLLPRCPVCGWEWRDGAPEGDPVRCPRPTCRVALGYREAESGGPLRARTFRVVEGYSTCVLPFSVRGDADLAAVLGRLEEHGRWSRRSFSLHDPEDIERTEYFLPYVRRFLFPSLFELPEDQVHVPAGGLPSTCMRYDFDLARLGPVESDGVPLLLEARDPRRRLEFAWPLRLASVELILFEYRVGFLILHFRGASGDETLFDQMDALTYLRTIAPLYRGFEMPELSAPGEPRYSMPQLLAFLLAEFEDNPLPPPGKPERIAPGPTLPVRPVYDDRMMVYSFSCLDRESVLGEPDHDRDLLRRATVVGFDCEPQLPVGEPDSNAQDAWLRLRWQGCSKDGCSLVVFDTDRFHENFLGTYHGTYYFDIFLLASLQRVTLLALFERLSDIPGLTTTDARSRKQLRRVRKDLLLFKNQCWFSQITNRERGLVLWRRWQEVFEVHTILKEVNEQSAELESYLQNRHRERVERLMRLGGFIATAVPAIFGLEVLLGRYEWFATLRIGLLALLFLIAGTLAVYFMVRREE